MGNAIPTRGMAQRSSSRPFLLGLVKPLKNFQRLTSSNATTGIINNGPKKKLTRVPGLIPGQLAGMFARKLIVTERPFKVKVLHLAVVIVPGRHSSIAKGKTAQGRRSSRTRGKEYEKDCL